VCDTVEERVATSDDQDEDDEDSKHHRVSHDVLSSLQAGPITDPTEPPAARPWVGTLVGSWSHQSTYTGDTKKIHAMPAAATTPINPIRPQR
jgi:hypothetical protein